MQSSKQPFSDFTSFFRADDKIRVSRFAEEEEEAAQRVRLSGWLDSVSKTFSSDSGDEGTRGADGELKHDDEDDEVVSF